MGNIVDRKRTFKGIVSLPLDTTLDEVKRKVLEYLEQDKSGQSKCKLCGKVSTGRNHVQIMKNHIETHLEGISYSCRICGKEFRTGIARRMHESKYHSIL